MMITASPTVGRSLILPTDHRLERIIFQSQMAFATRSISAEPACGRASAPSARLRLPLTSISTFRTKRMSGLSSR